MERRGLLAVFISLVIFGAAASAASVPNSVPLDQDFTLRINQSAKIQAAGLTVTFRSVLEDSRCPVDAVCVWAGNAKVSLDILDEKGELSSIGLTTGVELGTALFKRHELRFISLVPIPYKGVSITTSDYLITLRVVGTHGN